jgi:hypothetical protein
MLNKNHIGAYVIMFICAFGALLFAYTIQRVMALPNQAWEIQRIQAERNGDAQRLRVLNFVSKAGTLRYPQNYTHPETLAGTTHKVSCCGQADAYEADLIETDADGNHYAVLTCNDPDDCAPVPGKIERAPGTKFKIPSEKFLVNQDPVNDTGHGWVWISSTTFDAINQQPMVYCYSEPTLL